MLSAQDNRTLTEVGPGTPMGTLLRRYWHPIAGVRELDERPMRPIRILGEDLVLYRDKSGTYGLIDRRCPHRGSDLAYGIVDKTGLRCSYHGWCFDERGRCTDQPFEKVARPDSNFRDKVAVKSYQVALKAGLVWAYLGPLPAPCLTDWDRYYGEGQPSASFTRVPCNWLQCQENSIDPVHFEWLHQNLMSARVGDGSRVPTHQEISFEETDFGYIYRRILEGSDKSDDLWTKGRATVWPNGLFAGGFVWHVPMDDENTTFVTWDLIPTRKPIELTQVKRGELEKEPGGLYRMHDFVHQDAVGMLGQGTITDRTRESLGESDRGVILMRKRLLADVAQLQRSAPGDGWDPKSIVRDEAKNRRVELPFSPHAMPGYNEGGLRGRLRRKANALLAKAERLSGISLGSASATPLRSGSIDAAREAISGAVARVKRSDPLARIKRLTGRPPAPDIGDLIHGYRLTGQLYVLAKLGVADAIAAGATTSAEIAQRTGAHAPSLERLMRALVPPGVLAYADGGYRLTPLSERLRRDVPGSQRGIALLAGEEFMPAYGGLLHNVMSGDNAFRHVFGMSNWEHRKRHPELAEAYQATLIANGADWGAARLLEHYDLGGVGHIVDVGGGRGMFLAHLLKHHAKARGTVLDEPHVTAGAPAILRRAGVADRCEAVGGSFFEAVPDGGDLYILKNVLHNWDDDDAARILATCRRAMTHAKAKLLVLETVLGDDRSVRTADLHMMVVDGGRERDAADFRALFAAAELELVRTIPIAAQLSALELVRK